MSKPNTSALLDGLSLVTKGMNSGVSPRLLPRDQVAFAVNATFRSGLPHTRPVWRKVALAYADATIAANATTALFQDAAFYRAYGNGENCLVASIGGHLLRYLVESRNAVQDISIATDLNDSRNPNCWMWQSEDFLVVNNGAALPLFFDGAGVRRSRGPAGEELPAGCMGVYVQGRNWMVLPNAQQGPSQLFMASDLVNSHGFQDGYNGRSAVLKTEENTFLSGGFAFTVPVAAGSISAMAAAGIADTSLGQGPLQVMTPSAVFSVQVPLLREDWAAMSYPLMTVGLPNYGAVGASAVAAVNGDLWYRSPDGLRSYQIARRDFNSWVNTPLSVEMERVLERDPALYLGKCSTVLFNNRLLTTTAPSAVRERGITWSGLVALDFNNISTLTTRSQPAYDGLWTGLRILKIVKGMFATGERCFAFVLGCGDRIELWELLADGDGYFDWDGTRFVGVECAVESKSMGWPSGGNQLLRLNCADLYLDKVGGPGEGAVNLAFAYRSDEDAIWRRWHEFELCAPLQDCATSGCPTFADVHPQYRTYVRLPDPSDEASAITRRMTRTGYEFQVRMWWKGFLQLNRLHVWAQPLGDSVVGVPSSEACALLSGCEVPWFDYAIDDCSGEGGPRPPVITEEDPTIPIEFENGGEPPVLIAPEGPGVGPGLPPPPTTGGGVPIVPPSPTPPPVEGGGVPVTPPPPTPPPYPNLPEWPIPDPLECANRAVSSAILIYDPVNAVTAFVGIPWGGDPNAYIAFWGAPGCLEGWAAAVWADFLTRGIAYSEARLIWDFQPTTLGGFLAQVVFPDQPGQYIPVINLECKLVVEFCPI